MYIYDEITEKLSSAIKKDTIALMKLYFSEIPYVIALVADDRVETFYLTLNTRKALNESIKSNKGDERYYCWDPTYWTYGDSDIVDSHISNFCEWFSTIIVDIKEPFELYEKKMYECMVNSLITLREEKIISPDIIVFISISDDSRTELIENYSAKLLNSEEEYVNFVNRYDNDNDIRAKANKSWEEKDVLTYLTLMKKIKGNLSTIEKKKIQIAEDKILAKK